MEASGDLLALERGMLADLHAAAVMTTGQVWRLRFSGTSLANCRLRLERLARRGLVRRIPRGRMEACWCLTPDGCAAVGKADAVPAVPFSAGHEGGGRLAALLLEAEAYVERTLTERIGSMAWPLPDRHSPQTPPVARGVRRAAPATTTPQGQSAR